MLSKNGYEDPLGFTKQTATMLEGLGAGDLVNQFKKKNISTQALMELNRDDLIVLGASENLANDMLRQLRSASKKFHGNKHPCELKTNDLIKIFVFGNQQLHLVETFLAYARLRLEEKPEDFIINARKNVRASQALCVAASYAIAEIEELENNLKLLAEEFANNYRKTMTKSKLVTFISGMGIFAGVLCTFKYAFTTLGRS